MLWHTLDTSEVCSHVAVDPVRGLDAAEAARRLAGQGRNELTKSGGISPWRILWEQAQSPAPLPLLWLNSKTYGLTSAHEGGWHG